MIKRNKKVMVCMSDNKLHNKHRERVRERYLKEGIDSFEPHQALELILFYAIARKDTNELAHKLLDKFGSLNGVFGASPKELMSVDGIGEGTAVFLNLFSQIRRKCELDEIKKPKCILTSCEAGEFCKKLFLGRLYECFFMIALNGKNEVVNYEKISEGTLNEVNIQPRKVVSFALQNNAAKIIIAHNHPGGIVMPSQDDIDSTGMLKQALKIIGVEMSDHIIVSGSQYVSFKDLDLL